MSRPKAELGEQREVPVAAIHLRTKPLAKEFPCSILLFEHDILRFKIFKMYPAKKTTRKSIVIFLIFCLIAIRVSAGHAYLDSSIKRVEIYSGTCLSIDPDCSVNNKNNQIDLGDNPGSKLNLSSHLLGNLINTEVLLTDNIPHPAPPVFDGTMLLTLFQADIFHPPKI